MAMINFQGLFLYFTSSHAKLPHFFFPPPPLYPVCTTCNCTNIQDYPLFLGDKHYNFPRTANMKARHHVLNSTFFLTPTKIP